MVKPTILIGCFILYQVYLCKCLFEDEQEKYYVGYTNDFQRRMKEHLKELEFLRDGWFRQQKMNGFEAIVLTECADRVSAMRLEKKFKGISKEKKERIFEANCTSRVEFFRSNRLNN